MAPFTRVYTPQQFDAIGAAYVDRGIRPARRVLELAAAGQLASADTGEPLEPFTISSPQSVLDIARRLRRRRAGKVKSELATAEPASAIEALRRRLIALCDAELAAEERKRTGARNPERIRQIARALREAAALDTSAGRPPAPGNRHPTTSPHEGAMNSGATRGGLAGPLLREHRAHAQRAHEGQPNPTPLETQTNTETDTPAPHTTHKPENDTTDSRPGSLVLELATVAAEHGAGHLGGLEEGSG